MILVTKRVFERGKEYSLWKEQLVFICFVQSLWHAGITFSFGVLLCLSGEDWKSATKQTLGSSGKAQNLLEFLNCLCRSSVAPMAKQRSCEKETILAGARSPV